MSPVPGRAHDSASSGRCEHGWADASFGDGRAWFCMTPAVLLCGCSLAMRCWMATLSQVTPRPVPCMSLPGTPFLTGCDAVGVGLEWWCKRGAPVCADDDEYDEEGEAPYFASLASPANNQPPKPKASRKKKKAPEGLELPALPDDFAAAVMAAAAINLPNAPAQSEQQQQQQQQTTAVGMEHVPPAAGEGGDQQRAPSMQQPQSAGGAAVPKLKFKLAAAPVYKREPSRERHGDSLVALLLLLPVLTCPFAPWPRRSGLCLQLRCGRGGGRRRGGRPAAPAIQQDRRCALGVGPASYAIAMRCYRLHRRGGLNRVQMPTTRHRQTTAATLSLVRNSCVRGPFASIAQLRLRTSCAAVPTYPLFLSPLVRRGPCLRGLRGAALPEQGPREVRSEEQVLQCGAGHRCGWPPVQPTAAMSAATHLSCRLLLQNAQLECAPGPCRHPPQWRKRWWLTQGWSCMAPGARGQAHSRWRWGTGEGRRRWQWGQAPQAQQV